MPTWSGTRRRRRICHVVLFRDDLRTEQVCFFGTAAVIDWITTELGALRLDRLRPSPGIDPWQFTAGIRRALTARGLLSAH